jgi:hypothetical protein
MNRATSTRVRLTDAHRRLSDRIDPAWAAWTALVVLLVGMAVFLAHETSGTTFWFDEWLWVLGRRGNDLGTFLRPHNSHFSLVPILIYRLLFATAGLNHFAPYRAIVIAGHLLCVVLLFVYVSRRVDRFLALLAAALLLFLGPGWQNILWPFQIAWLISLACGIGMLLALDRRDRIGDVVACLLLLISISSSGIGLPFLVGAAFELLWRRERRREIWVVAVPLLVYVIWALAYQTDTITRHAFVEAPSFIAAAAAAALAALIGLAGDTVRSGGSSALTWGTPLAVAGAALLAWRLARIVRIPDRALTLMVTLGVFWILIAIGRSDNIAHGYDSRYMYVGVLLILLLAAELAAGVAVGRRAYAVLALATLFAIVSNLGVFRDASRALQSQAKLATADLGALDLARANVAPGYVATHFPGYPVIPVTAGPYFAAESAWGTPAASPAQLLGDPEYARTAADGELIDADHAALQQAAPRTTVAGTVRVDAVERGTIVTRGSCVTFRSALDPSQAPADVQATVPSDGVLVRAQDGVAMVAVRRFAQTFQPLGHLQPGSAATVTIARDRSFAPWHVQLATPGRATICALDGS